jgi:hypothetical protein
MSKTQNIKSDAKTFNLISKYLYPVRRGSGYVYVAGVIDFASISTFSYLVLGLF